MKRCTLAKLASRALPMLALLAALVFSASPAMADLAMYYLGPNGAQLGNVYTNPYLVTVNGLQMNLVCDDATANIGGGLSWKANEYSLSDVGSTGPQKFKTPVLGYTIQETYNAVGWLAAQILQTWTTADPIVTGERSFAIWDIFTPGVEGYLNNLTPEQKSAVAGFEDDALKNHSSTPLPYVHIYTPDPLSASQEFIGVPDGGLTLILLGGALVGLETLRRKLRM